ncbi:MAG: hypothetical protein EA345_03395 [Halomonas sp.]|nr:hypothetical protein [Halomonas sp.]TVP51090.1 MAG: hypothetical protein EA345_03395 [Halomonas sp.]
MSRKTYEQQSNRDEAQKAKQVIDKDAPNDEAASMQQVSRREEAQTFRPDENVDNQKAAKSRPQPSHNTSIKETPVRGAQLAKEKHAHKDNIDKKTDEAAPKGRE